MQIARACLSGRVQLGDLTLDLEVSRKFSTAFWYGAVRTGGGQQGVHLECDRRLMSGRST